MSSAYPTSAHSAETLAALLRRAQQLADAGDVAAAAQAFETAHARNATDLTALAGLAAMRARLGQAEAAEAAALQALALQPDQPAALRTLGGLYQLQARYDEALAIADAALRADPQSGEALILVGDSHANAGRPELALTAFEAARGAPGFAYDATFRMGLAATALGRTELALDALTKASRLEPACADPVYRRGLALLQAGRFAEGWRDYDARWRSDGFLAASRGLVSRGLAAQLATRVTADDLRGRRVLVVGEQGLGDQIMFASIVPDLAAVAQSVTCVCEPRLRRLFAASFPGVAFPDPKNAPIDEDAVDVVLAMGSLGHAFRRDAGDFPGGAYLQPSAEVRRRWKDALAPKAAGLRVGISWRGGVAATRRHARSMPLSTLEPVLSLPGCTFVSLQYGDVADELAAANAGRAAPILSFPAETVHDVEELAGLTAALDVVVSVQTAQVHLSGAVGTPCLAMLPTTPEWRYQRAGGGMPWYASVELFRQGDAGDWAPVVAAVAQALRAKI